MVEDNELLRSYAEERSQTAFAHLVERHIGLVYSNALRRVGGDTHLAEDVTQQVFSAMAVSSKKLIQRPVLAGWLHITTRNIAAQTVRLERRRKAREQANHLMNEILPPDSAPVTDWRPVIDRVLDELGENDREAVILRFFENRSLAEIGAKLRLTENAARMRVNRALDRMHSLLARYGVTSSAGAIALALANQPALAAPAGLAAKVITASLSSAATASIGITSITTLLAFMNTTKVALSAAALISVVSLGIAIHARHQNTESLNENARLQQKLAQTQRALEVQAARSNQAQGESDILLSALDRVGQTDNSSEAIPSESVKARYARAQKLARQGDWKAALPEFLWCYDEGMKRVAEFRGVRGSFLLLEITRMAEHYPPAMNALRERRNQAEERLISGSVDPRTAAEEYAALNHALGEDAQSMALFDKLPAGDPARRGLGSRIYDELLVAGRYSDAVEARPYSAMLKVFEAATTGASSSSSRQNPPGMTGRLRNMAITTAAKNIEALAGSGQLDQAREFSEKLLRYDNSPETRKLLSEHLTRAGHPDLIK